MSTTGKPRAPRPTLVQRAAAATARGIENFSDELYGHRVDRHARARQDRADLDRIAHEDAEAYEYLGGLMDEHSDLLTDEDEYGTEFADSVERAFVRKFGRELNRSERGHLEEYVTESFRDSERGDR